MKVYSCIEGRLVFPTKEKLESAISRLMDVRFMEAVDGVIGWFDADSRYMVDQDLPVVDYAELSLNIPLVTLKNAGFVMDEVLSLACKGVYVETVNHGDQELVAWKDGYRWEYRNEEVCKLLTVTPAEQALLEGSQSVDDWESAHQLDYDESAMVLMDRVMDVTRSKLEAM